MYRKSKKPIYTVFDDEECSENENDFQRKLKILVGKMSQKSKKIKKKSKMKRKKKKKKKDLFGNCFAVYDDIE